MAVKEKKTFSGVSVTNAEVSTSLYNKKDSKKHIITGVKNKTSRSLYFDHMEENGINKKAVETFYGVTEAYIDKIVELGTKKGLEDLNKDPKLQVSYLEFPIGTTGTGVIKTSRARTSFNPRTQEKVVRPNVSILTRVEQFEGRKATIKYSKMLDEKLK